MQNHGIGDIGHVKFIKAQYISPFGHALAQRLQRVHRALQTMQFTVYLAHEFMKMQSQLALAG